MYGHHALSSGTGGGGGYSPDNPNNQYWAPSFPPPPLIIPDGTELDSAYGATYNMSTSNTGSSSTAGYSGYGSPSCCSTQAQHNRSSLIQRSVSSHSLHRNELHHRLWSPTEFLDSETSAGVRRVFSAGDLQGINMVQHSPRLGSPLSNETAIVEGMSRASRYSPEEKKERIQRYRSKRNQRNFTKTIKYACRKTLADSRPRIRGRFARNDEIEKSPEAQDHKEWSHALSGEEEEDEDVNWINLLEGFPTNLIP